MTAGAMVEDRDRCLAAGMNDYVSKPIDLHSVGELLLKWVPTTLEPDAEPPIDPHRLAALRELGSFDDVDLLAAVVELFRSQAPGSLADIRDAVRVGSSRDLQQAAHALRGAADNVGATRVAGLCLELEMVSGSIDHDDGLRLVGRLSVELDLAGHALEQALLLSP
jgi:two-component system sensor histidine kinase/response regulator